MKCADRDTETAFHVMSLFNKGAVQPSNKKLTWQRIRESLLCANLLKQQQLHGIKMQQTHTDEKQLFFLQLTENTLF